MLPLLHTRSAAVLQRSSQYPPKGTLTWTLHPNDEGRVFDVCPNVFSLPSRPVNWRNECAAVIPCLNEAREIASVVRGVRAHLSTIIVIDDGSTDRTGDIAAAENAIVLRHEAPQGKGRSLREGWACATRQGFRWVLAMDGDGQHSPADIPPFLDCAERTGASLIIGNRMADAKRMPRVRRVVNRWMSRRLSAVAGRPLPDTQCGFRLISLDALARIPLTTDRYETESEQVLEFARAGERIEFVPISVIYSGERSKIDPFRDTLRWFRWLRDWKERGR